MVKKAIQLIRQARTIFIASHYHPDGDALGSSLALGLGLKKLGKRIFFYNQDPTPFNLKFLPRVSAIRRKIPRRTFDLAILVDCAQPKRISKEFAERLKQDTFKKILCIDHHLIRERVGDVDLILPKAPSTGSIVWSLLKRLRLHKNPLIATHVYCTLSVDTGSFRYSNTTAEVFKLAEELMRFGADPWLVARSLDESNPPKRLKLLAKVLQTLEVSRHGRYASMEISRRMLKETRASDDLTEDFANYPRSIREVEVSALFREMKDGRIKVSLRSKEALDVAAIAKQFGGGGHKHAAGCIIPGSLKEIKKKIARAVAAHLLMC